MIPFILKGLAGAVLLLGPAFFVSGCGAPVNVAWRPPTDVDVSEIASCGLKYEVTDFRWTYVDGGRRLQVSGRVRNNENKTSRAVIYGFMFDEKGDGVALGESWTTPRYLEPGQSGDFTIIAQTSRPASGDKIKNIRLLTNAQPE